MIVAGFRSLKPGYFTFKINNLFHEIKVTNKLNLEKQGKKLNYFYGLL